MYIFPADECYKYNLETEAIQSMLACWNNATQRQLNKRMRAKRVCETRVRHTCTCTFTGDTHLQTGHVLNGYDNRSHYFHLWSQEKAIFLSVYTQRLSHIFLAVFSHMCDMCVIVKLPLSCTVCVVAVYILSYM